MGYFGRFAWLPLLLVAGPACAHAPIPGIKGFYVGLLHPFSTPPQALAMVGLGLLIGGFAIEKARWHWGTFFGSVLLGTFLGSASLDLDTLLFTTAFLVCTTAALLPGRLMLLAVALTAIGGFLIGSVSIPDDGPTRDRMITMAGSIVGANVGLLYIFGLVQLVRERYTWPWIMVAFRVAAAWLGAIALLMFALGIAEIDASS